MILHVVEAHYVKDHTVWLRFNNGVSGQADLLDSLNGPIFEPMKDVGYFKSMVLDDELNTICWPNGADFAPEYLESKILRNTADNDQSEVDCESSEMVFSRG